MPHEQNSRLRSKHLIGQDIATASHMYVENYFSGEKGETHLRPNSFIQTASREEYGTGSFAQHAIFVNKIVGFNQRQLFWACIETEKTLTILQARALLARILQVWPTRMMTYSYFRHIQSTKILQRIFQRSAFQDMCNDHFTSSGALNRYQATTGPALILRRLWSESVPDGLLAGQASKLPSCFCESFQSRGLDALEHAAFDAPADINWLNCCHDYACGGSSQPPAVIAPALSSTAGNLCRLTSILQAKSLLLKELTMRLMTQILQHRPELPCGTAGFPMMLMCDIFVSSNLLLQYRSDLQKRINFERCERRLHFSPHVFSMVEFLTSLSKLERHFLGSLPFDDCQEPVVVEMPRLDHATNNSLHFVWTASRPVNDRLYRLEIADQVYGVPATDATYRLVYRGLHPGAIVDGLAPSRSYYFRVGLEDVCMDNTSQINDEVVNFNFRTTNAPSFVFDSFNKGPAISLSADRMHASFHASESWETILGTTPLISGCNSWELEIVNSSSLYIFVGVATRETDLATFLGGDEYSWGYIGDRALYHKRTKVKLYGERFGHGDIVGVTLNMDRGSLSFSKNGVGLGVAFDGLQGELYPAVAFYNKGQHVALVENSLQCPSAGDVLAGSPSTFNFDQALEVFELMSAMLGIEPMTVRNIKRAHGHCQSWLLGTSHRVKSGCGFDVLVKRDVACAPLSIGQYVRTPRGNACVLGSTSGLIWFDSGENGAWFYSYANVHRDASSGYFQRIASGVASKRRNNCMPQAHLSFNTHLRCGGGITLADFCWHTRALYFDREVNETVVCGINEVCQLYETSAWRLDSPMLLTHLKRSLETCDNARSSHKSVCCRVSFILMLNDDILRGFPFFLDTYRHSPNYRKQNVTWTTKYPHILDLHLEDGYCSKLTLLRGSIFCDTKQTLFQLFVTRTATHAKRAEDDYDYPEDLPQIVLNRLKAASLSVPPNSEASSQPFLKLDFLFLLCRTA